MDPTMNDLNAPHSIGTTIIGVTYNGGVVLGADSRTSTDSQIVSDYVRHFIHQHMIQQGQPVTLKVAANLVRLLSYGNKINSEGVRRNFYSGDTLPLWHEELEPVNSLLDILPSSPMPIDS